MRIPNTNKKGFTLIELIIVIAILAILAAVLIPNMVSYMDTANQNVADSNAQTVYMAASSSANILATNGISISDGTYSVIKDAVKFSWGSPQPPPEFETAFINLIGQSFSGRATFTFTDSDTANGAGAQLASATWQATDSDYQPTGLIGSYPVQP